MACLARDVNPQGPHQGTLVDAGEMTKVKGLHRDWMKNPKYKTEYEVLGKEFQLVRSLIEARTRAGLSQTQLARRMKTLHERTS